MGWCTGAIQRIQLLPVCAEALIYQTRKLIISVSQNNSQHYLLVKHSEGWNVDRCSKWMEKTGQSFDWCYPVSGNTFPEPERYSGVIIFGGAPSANDCKEHPWVLDELAFIEKCLHSATPFFGICLGAQMLARVLGAQISAHPDGATEVGFTEVKPTASGAGFLDQPLKFMQWHTEGFELPTGSTHLAYNDVFPNQAYSLNSHTYGVQFHPEVNLDVLKLWHERNKTRASGVLTDAERAQHIIDAEACESSITAWLENFLTQWTTASSKAA